jgi:hypothetical protein
MFFALASAVQRWMSARMNWPNCSGDIGSGSTASTESRSRSSGSRSTATCVSLRRRTTSSAIPAGPTEPYHCIASNPLKPDSSSVGTSFSCALRARPVTARARTRPERRCGSAAASPGNIACVWPPIRSVNAGAMPRYGMCSM